MPPRATSGHPETGISAAEPTTASRGIAHVRGEWNTYFLAYCRATGAESPDAALERDRLAYPGGCMAGYIAWNSERWREFFAARGLPASTPGSLHAEAFEAWLFERWPA